MKLNIKQKWLRFIFAGIIAIALYLVVIQPIYLAIRYRHSMEKDYKHYLWVLNDTIKLWPDTFFGVTGSVRVTDQYYNYNLEGGKYVHIFEYTDLNPLPLNKVEFNFTSDIPSFEHMYGSILNKDIDDWPEYYIKDELPFHHSLKVYFNKNAQLEEIRNTDNSKVFFGAVNKMMLSNAEGEPLALFDFYKVPGDVLIAFYSTRSRFLVIIITSDKKNPLKEDAIHLLKLK